MQSQQLKQQPQQIKKIEGSFTSPYGKIKFEVKQSQNSPSILKEIDQYVYNLNDVIGTGEFSSVYKGQNLNTNETMHFEQEIFRNLLVNENQYPQVSGQQMLALIIKLSGNNEQYINCDLQSIIKKKGYLTEHNGVIKVLLYLKERNIVHGDIKTQNILVSNQIPKLADFRLAVNLNQTQTIEILQIGTPLYMAPEIYSHYTQY